MDLSENGRALPGWKKKSFSIAFGGGEIWCEHLDGLYAHTELAIEKLAEDTPKFRRPSEASAIAFVLSETAVPDALAELIACSLLRPGKRFTRAAFIGCEKRAERFLRGRLVGSPFAYAFYEDFEIAKEWLVSERQ